MIFCVSVINLQTPQWDHQKTETEFLGREVKKLTLTMKNLLIFCILLKFIGVVHLEIVVETNKGIIKGVPSDDGEDYVMYLGIPYAVIDEDNPFGPATEHPGFTDTYEAYTDGVSCPQVYLGTYLGTLQCLQLNIYVPTNVSIDDPLPVMVYQHGGSFIGGNKGKESLSPKFLIRHDVIVVSINYRLGPYGFMCVSEPGYNNQGLKDQIMAYKWIRDNIATFGGDVNRITAFGQSAGAMSLDSLLLATDTLTQRVILQSGTATNTWVAVPVNDAIPIDLADYLGYETNDVGDAMEFLSTQNVTEVMLAAYNINLLTFAGGHPSTLPCVEPASDDAVMPGYPINLTPKVEGMDIMIGFTNRETMFLYPNSDEDYYKNFDFSEEILLAFNHAYDVDTVKTFYVGDNKTGDDLKEAILDFSSDSAFYYPTDITIQKYFEAGVNNVYRYVFSYEGGRNSKVMRNLTARGASHGDDLGYIFDTASHANQEISEEDQRMIDRMTTMWTNFAKYGNPTPEVTDLLPVKWLPADSETKRYMKLDKEFSMNVAPFCDRMAFWELYYKLHGSDLKSYIQQ